MDELELLKEHWKKAEAFLPVLSDEELMDIICRKESFTLFGEK